MLKSYKNLSIFLMAMFAIVITISSCKKDDDPTPEPMTMEVSYAELEALIAQANDLLANSVEGFGLGQYQFGAIGQLQGVVDNAQTVVDSQTLDQLLVSNAVQQLQDALDAFNALEVVSVATPWIQQIPNNNLLITDSDSGIPGGLLDLLEDGRDFTIELSVNPVSLQNLGFSNTLLSAAKQFNGPAGADGVITINAGFHVRYFSDGSIQFINGTGNDPWENWGETPRSEPGVIVDGEWNRVAYVHSGADRILYVNGTEVLRGSFAYKSIAGIDGVTGFLIGNAFDWTDRVANALIEDVRVWSKALEASELNDQTLTATGNGFEAWFPLKSDVGAEALDVSGNYKAVLGSFVKWAPDGDVNQVETDFGDLMAAIMEAKDFLATVTEGMEVGNFGIGTTSWVQREIDAGMAVIDNGGLQAEAAIAADRIRNAIASVAENTISEAGPANGLEYDLTADGVVGFRLTRADGAPPALPEGSYTLELDINMNDFDHPTGGVEVSLLGSGALQLRTITTPEGEDMNGNQGAIEFYVEGDGWTCACSPAGTMIAGEWVQIAAVYDESTNMSTLYLNGTEVASGENGAYTRRDNNGWGEIWLGNRAGDHNRLDGSARNLRIWDVARSASDIHADIDGTEDGLEMYFPLDAKNAPLYTDKTGNWYGQRIGVSYLD